MVATAKAAKALLVKVEVQTERDRKILLRRIEVRDRKVLKAQGAYIKTSMSRSMRYANKSNPRSKPGQPPRAHKDNPKGPMLRKLIAYEVNQESKSVVTGPVKFSGASGNVPQLLNQGGTTKLNAKSLQKIDFDIGDYGPIRLATSKTKQARVIVPGGRLFIRTLLETSAMTDRAARLVRQENERRQSSVYIQARPFTSPLLSDGGANLRKLIKSIPL